MRSKKHATLVHWMDTKISSNISGTFAAFYFDQQKVEIPQIFWKLQIFKIYLWFQYYWLYLAILK